MRKKKTLAAVVNPTSRIKTVTLNGKQLRIEFNFRGYMAMKELTGISLINAWDPSAMDAKEIACMFYAGLITHQPDTDIEFCFDSLNGENFMDVYTELMAAYAASLPPMKEDANPTKPIAK